LNDRGHILIFKPLSREPAKEILRWRYEPPYDIYNHRSEDAPATLRYLVDPANGFYSLHAAEGELIAFCSFGPDARVPGGDYAEPALDIGLGIRPDLTGQGRGPRIIGEVLAFAAGRFDPPRFRVTIAAFNERARKAWAKEGFVETAQFKRRSDGRKFVMLVREGKG
jgi:ribosomal-protein-alanine N-acetyltransferase